MKKLQFLNPLKALAMFAMILGLILYTGCGGDDDDDGPTEDIMTIIEGIEELDSLEKYLKLYPDLVETLESSGDFTLFAPNNSAFISLLAVDGFPPAIELINPDIIKNVLAYHMVGTRYDASDLTSGASLATLSEGNEPIVVNEDGTLYTGAVNKEIEILESDIAATNGVIHIVATVLIPVSVGEQLTPLLGKNSGTLLLGASFSMLAEAIYKAEEFAATASLPSLVQLLSGTTPNTVFAPTNETFLAGSISAATFTGQQWYGIIANHIVLSEVTGEDLTGTDALTGISYNSLLTFDGQNYNELFIIYNAALAQNGIGVFIDSNGDFSATDPTTIDGEVVIADAVENSNGIVHVIAGILAPPQ